jgi:hypothetical protein
LQRQVTPTDAVILTYAGNHGYDLYIANNHLNQTVAGSLYSSFWAGGFGGLPAASPDPRFATVTGFSSNGLSNYNGVSVQYKHIDRRGLTADISYTYSHALDDISNGGNQQLPYNLGSLSYQITPGLPSTLMYASSDYDVRNNFVMDLVYAEPNRFGNKFLNAVAGGWTVGGKAFWRSGEPFSVFNTNAETALGANGTSGTGNAVAVFADVLNNNFGRSCASYNRPCFQNAGIFNGTGLTVDPATGNTVPNYPAVAGGSSLVQPVQTDYGNISRNSFRGPHYADVDTSLYKDLFKKESLTFQVGAQAYNTFNYVNFAQPGDNASNLSTLGRISGDINAPTSPYGSSQQPTVAGRVLVVQGRLVF